jgi:hypothetical protein
MRSRSIIFGVALAALVSSQPSSVHAEEGGFGHYVPGTIASFVDGMPGRSTFALGNFFTYYDASSPRLELGGLVTTEVDATMYADTILGRSSRSCPPRRPPWLEASARRRCQETVQYVANIYKYYVAYRLLQDSGAIKRQMKLELREAP